MYTPFDFNEALSHRKEYIDDRLREGSPVVGLLWENGLLLLTVRRTQRKNIRDIRSSNVFGNRKSVGYRKHPSQRYPDGTPGGIREEP